VRRGDVVVLFVSFALSFGGLAAGCTGGRGPRQSTADAVVADVATSIRRRCHAGHVDPRTADADAPARHDDPPAADAPTTVTDARGEPSIWAATRGGQTPRPPTDAAPLPSPQPVGYPAGSAPHTEQKDARGADLAPDDRPSTSTCPPATTRARCTTRLSTICTASRETSSRTSSGCSRRSRGGDEEEPHRPRDRRVPRRPHEQLPTSDSADGKMPSETRIIRELIPYIDATYRTVSDRQLRRRSRASRWAATAPWSSRRSSPRPSAWASPTTPRSTPGRR